LGKDGEKAAPSEPARPELESAGLEPGLESAGIESAGLESEALKARLDAIREELEKDEGEGFATKTVVENVRSKVDDAVRVLEAMRLLEERQHHICVRTATAAFELYEETYVKARLVWREGLEKVLGLRDIGGVTAALAPYTAEDPEKPGQKQRTNASVRSEFVDCVERSFYSACESGDLEALDFVLSPPDFGEAWRVYMNATYDAKYQHTSTKYQQPKVISSRPLENKSLLGGPTPWTGQEGVSTKWLDVLGEPNSDFAKQLHKGLLLAIEHGQVFVVDRIKEKVQHVLTEGQTWWYDTDAYALAFKLKKRWILPLFVAAVDGRTNEWYRECSKIMTVQEFVEASEAEVEPCSTALRHELAEATRAKEALQHELAESTRAKAALQESSVEKKKKARSGQGPGCDQEEAERAARPATWVEVPPPSQE
jgi:hypothetical protein